jgi:hypothetical protein
MRRLRSRGIHLNIDGAWDSEVLGLQEYDLKTWGPLLRYSAPGWLVERFYREVEPGLAPFILYGSGDFHYLTALFVRRLPGPVTIVSFDNHPDWDRRPPRWSCGSWAGRALAAGNITRIIVWGCGNFELNFPHYIFADHAALRSGRLVPYAWSERLKPDARQRFECVTRENWKERFFDFVQSLGDKEVYVTVDLDCLRQQDAVSNWENGLFTATDIAWALTNLNENVRVIGGDICGAYSQPCYARWTQQIAGNWDHPKIRIPSKSDISRINNSSLNLIWPALLSGSAA